MKKGFTLLELIATLSVLGIISTIVINLIKPIDIIKCSRDTQRINDLNSLNSAISYYLSEITNPDLDGPYFTNSGFDESSSSLFVSVPKSKESTSTSLFYENKNWLIIQPSSTNFSYLINGQGWLPINFLDLQQRAINILPVDPINTFNKNYFYSYAFKRSAKSYELNAKFECPKFIQLAKSDGGDSDLFEVGTDINIIPPTLYGYSKTQLSLPSLNLNTTSLSIFLPIGQSSSTNINIFNTGTAYLKINQITQSNQNSFVKINKNNFIIAPYNTTSLILTCDGRALTSATTSQTTIFIWHNDPKKINPYPINLTCNFESSPLIEINPSSVVLEAKTTDVSVNNTAVVYNKGDDKTTFELRSFLYKETSLQCPNYISVTSTSNLIYGNSSTTLIFTLYPTSTKQDFYCKQNIYFFESNATLTIPVYVKIISTPSPPIIDQILPLDGQVTISWLKPQEDGGSEIIRYEIYNGSETLIATTAYNVLMYQHSNLNNGQKYCYKIKAVNKVGGSYFSQQRCIIPGRQPFPPVNLSALAGNKKVVLSWQYPNDDGGSVVDTYFLYYRLSGENNWRYLFEFPAIPTNSYQFTHSDLINGQTYEYTIRAQNQFGVSSYATITSSTPKGYPLPPGNLQTVSLGDGIRLTWNPPLSDEGSSVNYYEIYRATSSNFIFIASTTATSYDDYSVASNTSYYYYVLAVNNINKSKRSNIVTGCFGFCVGSFRCPSPTISIEPQDKANKIIINNFVGDLSYAIFKIYESTGDEYLLIYTLSSDYTYRRTGLINGKRYYYYVTQTYGGFDGATICEYESFPSNYVSSSPISSPLSPLSLNSSETREGFTQLNWEPPFSDEGQSISEYYVYKATSSPTSTYILINTTTFLSYLDLDNSISTPIYYYVRAKNSQGLGFKSNIVGRYNSQCFAKLYLANSKNNNFNDLVKLNNQYLSIGWQFNSSTQKYNAVLYKLDKLGNPIDTRISSTSNESSFNFILASSSYLILGGQAKINNYDGLLVKLNLEATNTLWSKIITGKKDEKILAGILDNNEIIITGYTSSFGSGDNDIFLSILNDNGTIKFFKTLGGSKDDIGQSLVKAQDGGYLILGYTNSFRDNYDVLLAKFDINGNLIWQRVYDSNGNDFASAITTTSLGYLIAGYSNFDTNHSDLFAISLDFQGNILWQKRYSAGGNDYVFKIKKDYDDNYVLIGRSNSYSLSNYDGLILKISSSTGEVLFANSIGWFNNDSFYGFETENGYYSIVGNSYYFLNNSIPLILKISTSSDLSFGYYLINKKTLYKFNLRQFTFTTSTADFKKYFSNFNLKDSKISFINYNLNWQQDIIPDYENLTNICNLSEFLNKADIENNLDLKNLYLFARQGSNYLYISLDNFLSYLKNFLSISRSLYRSNSSDSYNILSSFGYTTYATDTSPLTSTNCYRYKIEALFEISNLSNEHCVATTSDLLRPSPPINLSLNTNHFWNYIKVSYSPPQYNGGQTISYYKIYRATSTNQINDFILITTTTATSFDDNSVSNNINFCYYVTAVNSIGESDKSLIKCTVKTGLLSLITPQYVITSDLGIKLIWQPDISANYYLLERNNIKIATTNTTSYTDYNYGNEKTLTYKIFSIDNNSKINVSSLNIDLGSLVSPINLKYYLDNQSITLEWTSSSDYSIKYYNLYRKIKGSNYINIPYATVPSSSLSFVDSNVYAGETYCYKLTAQYNLKESLPSNEVCATILTLPQPSFSIKQTGLFGAWLVVDKINDYSDKAGFGKIREYRIYKATSSSYNLLATLTPDNLNYIDLLGLLPPANYSVSAINEIGENFSQPLKNISTSSFSAKFKYYKITTDNQIFEIGDSFSNTTLGEIEPGKKARNFAIYIEVLDPPKFINVVDINGLTIGNMDKIKEYKFICDNKEYNLDKQGLNRLYNLNLICSKMFIVLKWDSNLPANLIPKIEINNITINQ
ncbi:MAG: hypothetical protein KatS3mg095_0740 [Candidatus Parcubacteria bacterium]|nr:MAG: hypothetical protein KatS3mg095_0740 [Candidatus Parcubacteria bacterium]